MQELQAIQPTPGPDLAAQRRRLGVSQIDLAGRLGIHRTRLHVWERAAVVDPVRAARYMRALLELVQEKVA